MRCTRARRGSVAAAGITRERDGAGAGFADGVDFRGSFLGAPTRAS
jgi:hypothetical protein